MKLGILTFHQSVNNGAVMQAYSLAGRIQREYPFVTVEIVDYRMARVDKAYSFTLGSYLKAPSVRVFLGRCKRLLTNPKYLSRQRRRTRIFTECREKLPVSEISIVDDGTEAVFDYINQNYDVLVVGSDAVWNYVTRGFPNAYFPDRGVTCKKLSYAASCYGMDFLQCPQEDRRQIGQCLEGFDFIGVRDGATEDFVVWSGCEKRPVHTCDPTVFLDVQRLPIDVKKLKKKLLARGFDFDRPTVGMMGTPKMLELIRRLYGDKYQIAALYEYVKGADVNLYDLEPYEWAYVFRYFKLTFTTYFHGTLLSLRNGVPVICMALDTAFAKVHTPKTLDVLTRLGFPQMYFKSYDALEQIKAQADEFLQGNYRDEILKAMDAEAKSFQGFDDALRKIIDKEAK